MNETNQIKLMLQWHNATLGGNAIVDRFLSTHTFTVHTHMLDSHQTFIPPLIGLIEIACPLNINVSVCEGESARV